MLTRSKSKRGEGKLASYNPEIGSRGFTRRGEMEHEEFMSEIDKEFRRMFLEMKNMVKELWEDLERRRATPHQNEGGPVETMVKTEAVGGGEGEKPPSPSPSIIIIIIFFR
jgi:hypothetical protein